MSQPITFNPQAPARPEHSIDLRHPVRSAQVAKFTTYVRTDWDWGWRLRSTGNNKIIAISGEGFPNLADLQHSIELVKKEASTASMDW